MQRKALRFGKGFRVAFKLHDAQAAELVIEAGDHEGGPDNVHHGADQWVYVVSGTGAATIDGRRAPLKAGTLLVIERGEHHELRNTGRNLLKMMMFYSPPAFDEEGNAVGPGTR
ncbi:MAG TPA: cupin domain-containing protein [Rudaea sp.]|jgi:mannose-6-phosphate isomerase-like protein (cupin superfamily)